MHRKAIEAIRERGPENVVVVLQGQMAKPGEITEAGFLVQERKAPSAAPAEVLRSPKLSLR
jgi:hypothetical protein